MHARARGRRDGGCAVYVVHDGGERRRDGFALVERVIATARNRVSVRATRTRARFCGIVYAARGREKALHRAADKAFQNFSAL